MAGGACVCQASPQRQGHSAAHLALWLPGPMDSCGRPGSTSFEVEVKASLGTAPGAHQHHRAGHKMKTLPSSSANKLFLGFSKKNCQLFQNSHGENFHPLTASWPGSWEQRGQCSHGQRPSGLAPPVPVSTQTHCHQRRPLLTVYTEEDTFSPAHSATASRANPRLSAIWATGVSAHVGTAAPTHASAGYLSPGRPLSPVSGGLSLLEAQPGSRSPGR